MDSSVGKSGCEEPEREYRFRFRQGFFKMPWVDGRSGDFGLAVGTRRTNKKQP